MAEDVARQSSLGEGVPFCKQVASLAPLDRHRLCSHWPNKARALRASYIDLAAGLDLMPEIAWWPGI